MSDGDACSAACGWCGRCSYGPIENATCHECGRPYYRDEAHIGYSCDRCIANARARAECVAESVTEHRRRKHDVKPVEARDMTTTPEEVNR